MTLPQGNRAYRLRYRPRGPLRDTDLEFVTLPVPGLKPGQALVRTCYLSVDPTTRVWMSDAPGYMPPIPVGEVVRGIGVGQVVASRRDDLPAGACVLGWTGWQEYCLADDKLLESPFVVLPDPLPAPMPAFIGVLGHTGIAAYLGIDLARPHEGDTVVVSAAAGAVGSIAGQLARLASARVVGVAGGPEKCRHVVQDLGFDACVDYKAPDWRQRLDEATPGGVDVDFENVGGEIMDHVLMRLNVAARVVLCGMISQYNTLGTDVIRSQATIPALLTQRATLYGFLVLDHADRFGEATRHLAGLLGSGQLRYDETILDGLGKAPEAVAALFDGASTGKLVVRVAEPG